MDSDTGEPPQEESSYAAGLKRRFYVAHVRGAEWEKLRKEGFTVFYPALDDYVFLEITPANEPKLKRQLELGIYFLRGKRKGYHTVTQAELNKMVVRTTGRIYPGTDIEVVEGYCSDLEGRVMDERDGKVLCRLRGWRRVYEVWLEPKMLVCKKDRNPETA